MNRPKYEVRACWIESESVVSCPLGSNGGVPDFYGVYENQPDGTQQWVSDHADLHAAVEAAGTLLHGEGATFND